MKKRPVQRNRKRRKAPLEMEVPVPTIVQPSLAAPRSPFLGWAVPLAAWAAFSLVMLTFPNASWLFPPSQSWFFHESYGLLFVVFLALAASLKWLPAGPETAEDVPASWAWLLLPAILAVGAYLRLYHASTPMLSYWDDPAREITWGRRLFDLGDYSEAFVFERGHSSAEPFFMYWISLLWHLVPDWKSLVVQRLAGTLVDSAAILLMYLLGKEIAGRRAGLVLALMGALSKAMVMKSIDGLRAVTLPLAVALALWAFFRLVNKPSLLRFLQWAGAVALGTYTYSSYRPLMPFFLFVGLLWAWFRGGKKKNGKLTVMAGAALAALAVYSWYCVAAGSSDNWVSRVVDVSGLWLPCMAAAALMILGLRTYRRMEEGDWESPLAGWILACLLCILLTFPIMTDHTLLDKVKDNLHYDQSGWGMVRFLGDKAREIFKNLFWENMDFARPDFGLGTDSLFGYSETILIALGLASLVARPTWLKTFLFLTAVMAVSNSFMPSPTYSARVIGCVVPFLALGALGLEDLLRRILAGRGPAAGILVAIFLAAFTLWTAQGVLSRCYAQFTEKYFTGPGPMFERMRAYQAAMHDQDKGLRVYIDGELAHCIETGGGPEVLFEGRPVYTWHPTNTLYLSPNETLKDLSIYLAPQSTVLKDPISKAFPKIQWDEVRVEGVSDKPLAAYHCVIPAADAQAAAEKMAKAPAPLLRIDRVPEGNWTRDYFQTVNGLGMGVIDAEDKTVRAEDPIPADADIHEMNKKAVRLKAEIQVAQGGRFKLDCSAQNLVLVRLDGRRVLNLKFHKTEHYDYAPQNREKTRSLHLDAGTHEIEVILGFQRNTNYPALTLKPSGDQGLGKSLWDSFNF